MVIDINDIRDQQQSRQPGEDGNDEEEQEVRRDSESDGQPNGRGLDMTMTRTGASAESERKRTPVGRAKRWSRKVVRWTGEHLNFYRAHMLIFTFFPLIISGIFYASDNAGNSYVDCLTLCVSAMTVTGLNPILMETLSHWQQAIIFFLCCVGSTSGVSLITILIRRHFFRKRFEHMVQTDPRARKRVQDVEAAEEKKHKFHNVLHPFAFSEKALRKNRPSLDLEKTGTSSRRGRTPRESHSNTPNLSRTVSPNVSSRGQTPQPAKRRKRDKLRVDMIRRIDEPVRVNAMNVGGMISERLNSPKARDSLELQPTSSQTDTPPDEVADYAPFPVTALRSSDGEAIDPVNPVISRTESPTQMSAAASEQQAAPASPRNRRISIDDSSAQRMRRRSTPLAAPMESRVASAEGAADRGGQDPSSANQDDEAVGTSSDEDADNESEEDPRTKRKSSALQFQPPSRRSSDPAALLSRPKNDKEFKRVRTLDPPKSFVSSPTADYKFPRTQTIEIREPPHPLHNRDRDPTVRSAFSSGFASGGADERSMRRRTMTSSQPLEKATSRRAPTVNSTGDPLPRTYTQRTTAMTQGFGGFPNPVKLAVGAAQKRFASTAGGGGEGDGFEMRRTQTIQSVHSLNPLSDINAGPTKAVSYITFDAIVGRNSRFYQLTSAQRDELGGVEYRALSALMKIVAGYYFFVQFIPMIIFFPIMRSSRYLHVFQDQGTVTNNGGWYAAFNVVSAYSNAGLSLLDDSMVPFQRTYGWVLMTAFLILAGNTAFPVFLRLIIWTLSKLTRKQSRFNETLQFLLDHPRRCFIYLFPSHQTWVLVIMLLILNLTDWICFIVLDIGNPVIEALPAAARTLDGLMQGIAVRAAGFSIVPLSATAPALQVLYVIMMYIAVYPIALSIRSTNVYEEKSLGVFDDEESDSEIEAEFERTRKPGGYFAHHARRQLAFDIWWIGLALWTICIVERHNIDDDSTDTWFNVFTVLFELISAYGTVGLSLGSPNANYSLCGEFRTLSKLILCAVMIRGRHRGLPVAIDRSIMLPSDLEALHGRPNALGRVPTQVEPSIVPADTYFGGAPIDGHSRTFSQGSKPRRQSSNLSNGQRRRPSENSGQPPQGKSALNGYLSTVYSNNVSAAPTTTELVDQGSRGSSEESAKKP